MRRRFHEQQRWRRGRWRIDDRGFGIQIFAADHLVLGVAPWLVALLCAVGVNKEIFTESACIT